MYTRRSLLGAATIVAASVAGCSGAVGDSNEGQGGDPDGVRLDELSVQNAHDNEHRLQLGVEASGEMLHLGTYELDGGDSRRIDGEWTETSGRYRIHAALDDGAVQTADVTDGISESADCVRVLIRIDTEGKLAVWNGANCGTETDESDLESV